MTVVSFTEKLQSWCVRFRNSLTVEAIEALLVILRAENLPNLPKITFLQTKSNPNVTSMKSFKNTNGFYVYFGIQEGLKVIITNEYTESTVSLLFNIDGLPLYHGSSEQFWINSGLVLHNQYECQPFIVAAYSGNSKPQSVDEFLQDFVTEANYFVQNVATIGQREFKVEIIGFSCDTPARSFIKKCKGHGDFYACERCETRGITKHKRRIYPSMNSKQRTDDSFRRQRQKEHHLEGRSPLLDIKHFDPIRSVFLDFMHLFYLGNMKWILEQLVGINKKINRKCKLHTRDVKLLNSNLKILLRYVAKEF